MGEEPDETEPVEPEKLGKKRRRWANYWTDRRLFSRISKSDPSLMETLNEYSEATGLPPDEIIRESLTYYLIKRRISQSNMTVDQLFDSWVLLQQMQEQAIKMMMAQSNFLFSEQYQQMLELGRQLQPEIPAKIRIPRKMASIQDKILDKFEPLLDFAIDWAMQSFFKSMGMKTPPQIKKPIPVTITYEEEKEAE